MSDFKGVDASFTRSTFISSLDLCSFHFYLSSIIKAICFSHRDKFSKELRDELSKLSDGKCYSRIGTVSLDLQIIFVKSPHNTLLTPQSIIFFSVPISFIYPYFFTYIILVILSPGDVHCQRL